MRSARAGLSGLRPADKVAKALLVGTRMTGNTNFPTPAPTLADLTTAREALEVALVEAAAGDRVKIFERNVTQPLPGLSTARAIDGGELILG